jgi:hypothetical protein
LDSSRLVTVEVLLQSTKMDPLVALHYFALVCSLLYRSHLILIDMEFQPCAVFCAYLHLFAEGLTPIKTAISHLGYAHLLANGMIAFMLNIVTVLLLELSGGVVVTLAGAYKVRIFFL